MKERVQTMGVRPDLEGKGQPKVGVSFGAVLISFISSAFALDSMGIEAMGRNMPLGSSQCLSYDS